MAYKILQYNGLTWYHYVNVEVDDLEHMRRNFKFHQLTINDITSTLENPKLDVFKKYVFGVFHFPEIKKSQNILQTHEIDVYVGEDYVITIQESKFRTARSLFFKVVKNHKMKEEFFSNGANYLFYNILKTMFNDSFEPTIEYFGKKIKELEESIYEEQQLKESLIAIGILRRNILNFKKIVAPQMKLLNSLSSMDNAIISAVYSEYYDDIDDYIERVWSITNNHQEIIEGLNLSSESLISFRTNEVIKLLTIFSVAILPLTLFSGIYGMNINLPFQQEPVNVWLMFGGLLIVIVTLLFYFMRKNR